MLPLLFLLLLPIAVIPALPLTSTWATYTLTTGPEGACDHSSLYNPITNSILYTNGNDVNGDFIADLWMYDLSSTPPTLFSLPPLNSPYPPLLAPSSFLHYTANTSLYYEWGGRTNSVNPEYTNQLSQIDVHQQQWLLANGSAYTLGSSLIDAQFPSPSITSLNTTSTPVGLAWGISAWLHSSPLPPSHFFPTTSIPPPQQHMIVIGGTGVDGLDHNEMYTLDLASSEWSFQGNAPFPPTSGMKSATINGTLWVWGGYMCTQDGLNSNGGSTCFSNTLYALDTVMSSSSFLTWRQLNITAASPQQQAAWPSQRAWHTMNAWKHYLLIFGGYYIDESSSPYWFNDVFVFDTHTLQFIESRVRGSNPHIMWSMVADVVYAANGEASLVVYGGCTSLFYSDKMYVLKLGQYIQAGNCTVSGPALEEVVAGEFTWLLIETRDNNGEMLTWGTGLLFDVFILGTDGVSGLPGRVDSTIQELGDGVYNVSFNAQSGTFTGCTQLNSNVKIHVKLDGVLLPGSPWSVPITPTSISTQHSSIVAVSRTDSELKAVRQKPSYCVLDIQDSYNNKILVGSGQNSSSNSTSYNYNAQYSGLNLDSFHFSIVQSSASTSNSSLATSFSIDQNGLVTVSYIAPSDSSFQLAVAYNGEPLMGSPFTVKSVANLDIAISLQYAVLALAILFAIILITVFVILAIRRSDSRIRASSFTFLSFILFGSLIGISSLFLPVTPALQPISTASCQAYAWLLGFGFTITFSAIMLKTWRIARIFNSQAIRIVKLPDSALIKPLCVFILVELIFNLVWIFYDPLKPTVQSKDLVKYSVCSCTNLQAFHGVTFFSKALLVAYGIKLSSSVRKVPNVFNESAALTAAINNIAVCGVVVVPLVYFQALEENQSALYALKSLIVLWCFLFTPLIIIVPKFLEEPNQAQHTTYSHPVPTQQHASALNHPTTHASMAMQSPPSNTLPLERDGGASVARAKPVAAQSRLQLPASRNGSIVLPAPVSHLPLAKPASSRPSSRSVSPRPTITVAQTTTAVVFHEMAAKHSHSNSNSRSSSDNEEHGVKKDVNIVVNALPATSVELFSYNQIRASKTAPSLMNKEKADAIDTESGPNSSAEVSQVNFHPPSKHEINNVITPKTRPSIQVRFHRSQLE